MFFYTIKNDLLKSHNILIFFFFFLLGVVKLIYLLIKNDRKAFRKRFGVQYFLDTIRTYYTTCDVLSINHITILRASLLDIIRYYISKEVIISDVDIIIRYLITCRSETMVIFVFIFFFAKMY